MNTINNLQASVIYNNSQSAEASSPNVTGEIDVLLTKMILLSYKYQLSHQHQWMTPSHL